MPSGGAPERVDPIDVAAIAPIGRQEAMALAATEYQRGIDLLRKLEAGEWPRPTACELWDVRAIAGHMLGMAEAYASRGQLVRDYRAGRSRDGGTLIDAITAYQVRERAHLSSVELINRFSDVAPRAVEGRRRLPSIARRMVKFGQEGPFEGERWTLGYIIDTLGTRDPWMHRIDICRATDRSIVLSGEHDGRIVAAVVAEWARRHARPFTLTLTGAAGGRWVSGAGGEHVELDAVEFCWKLSGRGSGVGLLATAVPF